MNENNVIHSPRKVELPPLEIKKSQRESLNSIKEIY